MELPSDAQLVIDKTRKRWAAMYPGLELFLVDEDESPYIQVGWKIQGKSKKSQQVKALEKKWLGAMMMGAAQYTSLILDELEMSFKDWAISRALEQGE